MVKLTLCDRDEKAARSFLARLKLRHQTSCDNQPGYLRIESTCVRYAVRSRHRSHGQAAAVSPKQGWLQLAAAARRDVKLVNLMASDGWVRRSIARFSFVCLRLQLQLQFQVSGVKHRPVRHSWMAIYKNNQSHHQVLTACSRTPHLLPSFFASLAVIVVCFLLLVLVLQCNSW